MAVTMPQLEAEIAGLKEMIEALAEVTAGVPAVQARLDARAEGRRLEAIEEGKRMLKPRLDSGELLVGGATAAKSIVIVDGLILDFANLEVAPMGVVEGEVFEINGTRYTARVIYHRAAVAPPAVDLRSITTARKKGKKNGKR